MQLRPTSIGLDIQDFHLYFIIIKIFLSPYGGIAFECSPSTQVLYGLQDTLGCFTARTANPYVFKPSYSGFPYIVV